MLRYLSRQEILNKIHEFDLEPRLTQPVGNTFLCLYGFIESAQFIELALPGDSLSLVPKEAHIPMPTVHPMVIKDRPKIWLVGGAFTLYNAARMTQTASQPKTLANADNWDSDLDEDHLLLKAPFLTRYAASEYIRLRQFFKNHDFPLTPDNVRMVRLREKFDFFWFQADDTASIQNGRRQEREFDAILSRKPELAKLFRAVDISRGRIKDRS